VFRRSLFGLTGREVHLREHLSDPPVTTHTAPGGGPRKDGGLDIARGTRELGSGEPEVIASVQLARTIRRCPVRVFSRRVHLAGVFAHHGWLRRIATGASPTGERWSRNNSQGNCTFWSQYEIDHAGSILRLVER
jgi:hypothetical protein